MEEKSVQDIAKALQDSNATDELIFETLDGFNPILNSSLAKTNLADTNAFFDLMLDTVDTIKEVLFDTFSSLSGSKLQDEENRREMVDVLKGLYPGEAPSPSPLPDDNDDDDRRPLKATSGGLLAGITAGITSLIPAGIAASFGSLLATFKQFFKFGKQLIKFAGPLGIAISVIVGLVGSIKGAVAGYKEDGIVGAIKGAIIGLVDSILGSILKSSANILGWVFDAIGMNNIGQLIGPLVADMFSLFMDNIKGLVDLVVGIFTLDSDKVIGAVKQLLSNAFKIWEKFGTLLVALIGDIIPLTIKVIKGIIWDLPVFIGELLAKGFLWLKDEGFPEFMQFLDEVWTKTKEDLLPYLYDQTTVFLDKARKAVSDLIDSVSNWFSSLFNWDAISEKMPNPFSSPKRPKQQTAELSEKEKELRSKEAGYNSWKEYEKNKWVWRGETKPEEIPVHNISPRWEDYKDSAWKLKAPDVQAMPSSSGMTLGTSGGGMSAAPIIINQMGGNVTNTSTSTVQNNNSQFEPIMTGSAMGFVTI